MPAEYAKRREKMILHFASFSVFRGQKTLYRRESFADAGGLDLDQ